MLPPLVEAAIFGWPMNIQVIIHLDLKIQKSLTISKGEAHQYHGDTEALHFCSSLSFRQIAAGEPGRQKSLFQQTWYVKY